jgi:AraC-like DNA-binding protein
MELIFNMGEGSWATTKGQGFQTNPPIELWGQITKPLAIRSSGRNIMLGVRFYPHSAAYFFNEDVSVFNNEVIDATGLFGGSLSILHERLFENPDIQDRITLMEEYLLSRLVVSQKISDKIKFVGQIADSLKNAYDNEKIASVSVRNNISSRYLNQLFTRYTGLPPKLFFKINRFKYSLQLISNKDQKFTGIAYESGYFDQSHFIREFKLFTGVTPAAFSDQASPINLVMASN